ncbi:MAG: 30S ribosomal protein S6 [Bryobacterales bacterium]|nr:30S ribosomal protein S6 [Bryobacterales bacterium]
MRIYEELYILKPDTTEEDIEASVELIRSTVLAGGGTVDKVDKWGMRKLAYKVEKFSDGYYVLVQFSTKPEVVKEVERRLRVADSVIKYITVRIDEKLKWLEKRKKIREKRAARKPPAPQALPAIPGPGAPAAPGAPMPGAPVPGAPAPAAPAAPAPAAPEAPTPAAPETPAGE